MDVNQLIDYELSNKRIINGLGAFYAVSAINKSINNFKRKSRDNNVKCNAFFQEFNRIVNSFLQEGMCHAGL